VSGSGSSGAEDDPQRPRRPLVIEDIADRRWKIMIFLHQFGVPEQDQEIVNRLPPHLATALVTVDFRGMDAKAYGRGHGKSLFRIADHHQPRVCRLVRRTSRKKS
jgi:hypothetical protein